MNVKIIKKNKRNDLFTMDVTEIKHYTRGIWQIQLAQICPVKLKLLYYMNILNALLKEQEVKE